MQSFFRFSHRFFPSWIFIVALFAAVPGYAQQREPVTIADEIVVTATRFREPQQELPVDVTVINEEQIRASTAATVPELLKQFPGIQVRDNSGSPNQQVDLRGFGIFGDQNTLVLLDGQRISENEQTTVNWAAIPLSAIERIEIMRGSGAVLYGAGATGGTINIITKAPLRNQKSAYASGGYGSYNMGDYRARLNLAGENLGLIFNGSHLETDNYRDSNRLRQQNAQADLRLTGERGALYAKFGVDDQQLLLPGALSEAQIMVNRRLAATPGDFSHTSGGYANLGGELRLGDAEIALNAGYRGKVANSAFFVATPFRNNISTQVNVMSLTPRAKIPFALGGMSHTLVAGIDWDDWDFDSTASAVASHSLATQRDTAWYLQDSIALGAATVLSLGGRMQRTNYGVSEIAGGAAATRDRDLRAFEIAARHRLTDALSIYGKFGNSFRLPNVNDNFNLFTGAIALLEPQTSHDREIGTELKLARSSYRLAIYNMDVDNEIHSNPDPLTIFLVPNINLPPTRRYGAELEGKWSFTPSLSVIANYTYAAAKFRSGSFGGVSVADKDVPLVPHAKANLGASWKFLPRTRLDAVVNYVGDQVFDADETNTFGRKMPGYTLADAKLSHEYRGWLLNAGVKNLFNRKYFTYGVFSPAFFDAPATFFAYPAAERSVFVSAQYTIR
jgi:iron complex outermembrane receptor protein